MKLHIRVGVLSLLTMCVLSGSVLAAEDYDGYLVRMTESVSLFSESANLPEGIQEVHAPAGLYKIDDPELVGLLQEEGLVAYAEPNYRVELFDVPDDTAYLEGKQWNLDAIDMDYAWTQNVTGEKIRVGVIDSGIYLAHEDFAGITVLQGVNYCVDETSLQRTDVSDAVGHGTFVSGVIAAAAGNGIGTAGIAPGVELVPLKCFSQTSTNVSQITEAIYDAVDVYHCRVLNMSFGLPRDHSALREAVAYAAEQGTVMVAAVGNLRSGAVSSGDDTLQYPAAYDEVIGVGAAGKDGTVADFSYQNESVFLTAPGEALWGLSTSATDAYTSGEGTSYAAPAVSAAATLALSLQPELTPVQLMELLAMTAADQGETGWDSANGWGLLQVSRLLAAAQRDLTYQTERFLAPFRETAAEPLRVVVAAYDEQGRMECAGLFQTDQEADIESWLVEMKTAARIQMMLLGTADSWLPSCVQKEYLFLPE